MLCTFDLCKGSWESDKGKGRELREWGSVRGLRVCLRRVIGWLVV